MYHHTHHPVYAGIHHPAVRTSLYTPGYTMVHTTVMTVDQHPVAALMRRVAPPWAQAGNKPWVGETLRLMVLKSVSVDGRLCAELLRSSLING